jgi:hypothetical protein
MSFLDKAKDLAEQAKDIAGDALEKAGDLAAKGVDIAATGVDKATGGRFHDKIESVLDRDADGDTDPGGTGPKG